MEPLQRQCSTIFSPKQILSYQNVCNRSFKNLVIIKNLTTIVHQSIIQIVYREQDCRFYCFGHGIHYLQHYFRYIFFTHCTICFVSIYHDVPYYLFTKLIFSHVFFVRQYPTVQFLRAYIFFGWPVWFVTSTSLAACLANECSPHFRRCTQLYQRH